MILPSPQQLRHVEGAATPGRVLALTGPRSTRAAEFRGFAPAVAAALGG